MSNRFTPEQLKAVADAAKKQKASQKQKTEGTRLSQQTRERLEQDVLDGFKKKIRADTLASDEKKLSETLSSLDQRQKSNAYVDPKEWEDAMSAAADISNRYRYYERYLDRYGDESGSKTAVQNALSQYSDMSRNLGSMRDFYGQFEDAEAFQTYTDKKKREDYLTNEYDLAKGKADLDEAKKAKNVLSGVLSGDAIAYKKRYDEMAEDYRRAKNLQRIASYDKMQQNPDFATKSVAGDDILSRFLNMSDEGKKTTDMLSKASDFLVSFAPGGNGIRQGMAIASQFMPDINDVTDKYHALTDEQKKVYNYLNNTKGTAAALEYLYDIGDELSRQAAIQQKKEIDTILPDNWLGDRIGDSLSLDNALHSGMEGAISSLGEGIYQTFAQNDRVLNTSVSANRFGLDREEAGKVQKVFLDLAQTTGNMLPSAVLSAATGVPILGAGMMGIQAKGAAYNQAIKEGYSPAQAQTYSTMVGALEGGLSYALTGIGKGATKMFPALGKAIDGISNGFLRGLASWGVEAAGEGLEEGLTEFFDPFLRYFVTGKYEGVNWKDVGYSAFLGALSGGFLEGTPAAMKAVSLPDATAEAFKTKYDTGNGYEGFSSRLFQDDTLLSAKVIELVKEDDANGAIAALNKGLHNYRFAKEYARQHYGVTAASDIDKRIQTIETLKASIKAGKFNAQSAETALRKTSDIWQIAAENNDAVVDALTSGNLSNSKIEQKVLKDRGTINAFKRKTGVDLDSLSTISQKRQAVREASAGYQAFVQTDAYRTMQELTKVNETEKDASKVVANKRKIIDGMLALHNQAMAEADAARRNGNNELADQKKVVSRLADAALNSTRNDKASYFASNRSSAVDYDELSALGDQYLPSLSAEDRSTLTGVRSVADLKRAEVDVKEKLNKQRDEAVSKKAKRAAERQLQAVDAYFVSAMTSLQNVNDAALAEARTIVDERIKAMNKNLRRYGVTVEGFANGVRYFDTDGKEISYDEVLEKQRRGEAVRMNVVRGMNSERTLAIAHDIASGVVPVMNPLNGQIVQMKVGRGEGMVSPERAVDIILAHEAVHYAEKYGQTGLVDSIIHKIAGTRLDTQYELANRLKNRPVSEAAAKNWDKLKNTYADVIAKERKISREDALSKVDDAYLYEEIAADYMGTLMANNSFAEALAAQDGNLFKRIVRAIRDLIEGLRNGGMVNHERAAKDLATRLEAIAKKTYGRMEKKVDASTSEKAAESPVGNVSTEEGTNEGDAANDGDAQESDSEDAETVMENAKGEVVGVDDGNGSARFSIATFEDGGREALSSFLDSHVSDSDLSQEDADDILSSLDEIYDICLNFENDYAPFGQWSRAKVETDRDGNPVFTVVKSNGDYALNLDFSLVCKKRRALDAVFNRLIEMGKINTFDFGQEEIVRINEIIREHGFEVACALCFVDAKRFRQAKVADQFVTMYNGLVKSMDKNGVGIDYFNFGGDGSLAKVENGIDTRSDAELDFTKIDKVLAGGKKGTVIYKIAQHLKENPQDRRLVSRGDFMSSHGFGEVKKQNPAILSLYNSKKGSSGPKAAFGDVQYLNEIISSKKFNAEDAYDVGGVRIQSFSDYVARLVFDYAQMVADLAAKQLPAHAYTKEVLFAKQFGLTGIKINMSLIPSIGDGKHAGLNADGSYAWASESFPVEEAFRIQSDPAYGKNCGTIAVGVSDEHIRKMLEDPQIRMVIPYHKSGINPIVAHMMNIKGFTDYTKEQNTRYRDGKKLNEADMSHVPDFNQMMHREGLDAVEASRRYVAWCEERGYRPKFDQFAYKTVDGKRVFNENYYKLLEDFTTMVDGKFHPQEAVRAVYPDESSAFGSMKELIRQGLEEDAITVGNLEADTDTMVEEISEVLKDGEKRYSVAGELSLDADLGALDRASKMYQNGDRKNDIVRETGWWLGKDGKWRYEISDEDFDFTYQGKYPRPKTVGDYVTHDRLFRAYPMLQDIRLVLVKEIDGDPNVAGEYDADKNVIALRLGLPEQKAKETMLHEIQHIIQVLEEFNQGSSPEAAAVFIFNSAYAIVKDTDAYKKLKTPQERMDMIVRYVNKRGGRSLAKQAFDVYFNYYGENEANAVASRMRKTEQQRREHPIDHDGYMYSHEKIKPRFVDNLKEMGYNGRQINKFKESGLHDYLSANASGSNNSGGFGRTAQGNTDRNGNPNAQGGENERFRVSGTGNLQGSKTSEIEGNLRQNVLKYSASGEFDADGNELSVEQAEHFKDSVVRDENGNLLKVYHGSKNSGFNVFKYDPSVQTGTDYGEAYYFTSDRQKASGYSYDVTKDERVAQYKKDKDAIRDKFLQTRSEEDKNAFLNYKLDGKSLDDLMNDEGYLTDGGEVKEVYLNITNPLIVDAGGKYYYEVYPEYFEQARANGNDGIIVKNVIDNPRGEARPIDTYIAFEPNQIKSVRNTNPTADPDIRFSSSGEFYLDDGAESYDKLKRQIAEQKEKIHRLTEEMVLSHGTHLDVKETGRFLKELLTRYGATLTVKDIEADVNDITEYLYRKYDVTRDEKGRFVSKEKVKEIDAAKLNDRIQRLATRIMESAVDVDSRFEEYTSFLKTLHNTPIGITEEIKQAYGDGWGAFRQRNFGRLNLRNAETSDLSAFYQEMADNYPEILDSSISDPVEQLKQLADAAKTIRETGLEPKNIYGLDGESVVADIAYDFSSGIASIDPAMNFADKAQQKVEDAKAAGKQAVKTEGRRGDFRVAEQRLADDMYYGKKIAAIRERYEARLDEMAERFATKVKDRSEEQQVRYQKKMIEKRGKDLAKRLAKPTKAKHVPEEMVADVYALLKQITWPSKTKVDRDVDEQVASFLETVEKRYDEDHLKPVDGVGFPEALKNDIKAFNFKALDSQNAQQLHDLNELLRRAVFAISNYDKVFHSGEKASVESMKAFDHFRVSRREMSEAKWWNKVGDYILNYAEDPEAFFTILNVPELTEAYHRIGEGQDKLAKNVKKLTADLANIVGDRGVPKEWREQVSDYTVSTGTTLRMTPAQLMSLYLYSKQADSRKCLLHDKGGIAVAATEHKMLLTDKNGRVVETNELGKLKNLKDVRHIETASRKIGGMAQLNEDMLDELLSHLTKEQREMADRISVHLNTTVADMANETSLETEGYRKFVNENYFPMLVFDRSKSMDEVIRDMHGQIMTEGFTKERTGLAGKKLIVDDIFSVVNRHDVSVAQYNAYKKALLDYKKLLTIRPEGDSSLESQIQNYFGVNLKNRVSAFLNDFLLDVQGVQMATGEETLLSEKFLRNFKAAQVAANLSVVAKQPTSILRAMPEFTKKGIAAMKPVGAKQLKADIAEMQEHSGLAFFKANGYSEYANARSFEELYNRNALSLRDHFDNAMSKGAEQMDLMTWAALWRAAKAETNSIEEATAKFNEVIRKTQVVDTALTSSRVTKQNGLMKMAFAFRNEPLKSFNYIRATFHDYAIGKEGSGKKLAMVLASSGTNALLNAAITAAVSMLRDDEEGTAKDFFDKTNENFWSNILGDTLIFAGDFYDAVTAAFDGRTVERMDLAAITDTVEALISVYKFVMTPESERRDTLIKLWHNVTKAISNLTGIPISNFSRFQHTLGSLIGSVFNDPWLDYLLASRYYNADGFDNTQVKKKFRSILTDALNDGDYEGYARVKNELLSKGFSTSEIEKAIANSDVFYKAFNKGPEAFRAEVNAAQKYDPTISSTSVMSAIKSRKTGLVSDLYDAAKAGDKKAVQTVRDELLQLRDVDTKRLLTDKDIDRLLQEKYEKQLKSDVKERLVDLYGTEVYETIKRVILSEYRKFGVTSEEIDRIARSLR